MSCSQDVPPSDVNLECFRAETSVFQGVVTAARCRVELSRFSGRNLSGCDESRQPSLGLFGKSSPPRGEDITGRYVLIRQVIGLVLEMNLRRPPFISAPIVT